ncbi:MAG: SusD/RagB family nutrient-binding outer membrane lipoprotein, partial [Chitinophagaceae bacterium]
MKTMNKYIAGALAIAAVALLSSSCKQEMIRLNSDPNSLPTTAPEYLFTGTTQEFNLGSRQQLINRYTFMQYMQYIVPDGVNANLRGAYWAPGANTGPSPSATYYGDYYSGIGVSMNRIIAQINAMPATEQTTYQNLKAVCQIVNTYCAWKVDDFYGAMVYSQAFDVQAYPLPAYDYDWTLYMTFDSTLKVAATTLQAHATDANQVMSNLNPSKEGDQDFFYGGNMSAWLAFANTLRIKIAQRYEKRDPAHLANVLSDIQQNFSSDIISSNDQSFGYNQSQ